MHGAHDQPVFFHLPQLLREHLLRHAVDQALQVREALHLPAEQVKHDEQLPAPVEQAQCALHADRRAQRRVPPAVLTRPVSS